MCDRQASILIVDYDPINLRLMETMLQPEGHLARPASNGAEAMAAVAAHPPDLILLDVMLPDLSGFEVAALLKANPTAQRIPIIMMAGQDDRMFRIAGLEAGAEDFISKPVDRSELLIRVRNLLRVKESIDFLTDHNRMLEQLMIERTASLAGEIQERKRLEQEILKISDYERQRIGRDLHDSVCQQLTGIELMSHTLMRSLASVAPEQAGFAAHMASCMREVITEVRMIARGLSPLLLEPDGLMAALPKSANSISRMFGVRCNFHCPEPVLVHNNHIATNLYRISQEAISNAIRHGRARRIDIGLKVEGNHLILSIKDDGIGLPSTPLRNGLGLGIMQYRATMAGGRLQLHSENPGGTMVTCRIPHAISENSHDGSVAKLQPLDVGQQNENSFS